MSVTHNVMAVNRMIPRRVIAMRMREKDYEEVR